MDDTLVNVELEAKAKQRNNRAIYADVGIIKLNIAAEIVELIDFVSVSSNSNLKIGDLIQCIIADDMFDTFNESWLPNVVKTKMRSDYRKYFYDNIDSHTAVNSIKYFKRIDSLIHKLYSLQAKYQLDSSNGKVMLTSEHAIEPCYSKNEISNVVTKQTSENHNIDVNEYLFVYGLYAKYRMDCYINESIFK